MKMKMMLLIVVSCLVLHSGEGAPMNAVYKFVTCNPSGDQANCVTQQTPEMAWSPDLPSKLPASSAQFLEAEPVEDESPLREEEKEENEEVEEEEIEEEDDEEAEEEAEEEDKEAEEEAEEEDEEAEEEAEEEEERWEEDKEEEEKWEDEQDVPFISEEWESPVPFSEGGSGASEGSADASLSFGDVGSGDYWTEEAMPVVGESRPSDTRSVEQELQEEHLLSP